MGHTEEIIRELYTEKIRAQLRYLYGEDEILLKTQQERYAGLILRYTELFGDKENIQLISAPGRTEIGGNHTDHNHGRVLAAFTAKVMHRLKSICQTCL